MPKRALPMVALTGLLFTAGCGFGAPQTARSATGAQPNSHDHVSRPSPTGTGWRDAVYVGGHAAVEYREVLTPGLSPITLLRVDQRLLHLHLHAGSVEPPTQLAHWRYGPEVTGAERTHLVVAFNGGFKMADVPGGWMSEGRVVVPLRPGAPSVVIYSDGTADVVPGTGRSPVRTLAAALVRRQRHGAGTRTVVAERQNVGILVQHGVAATTRGLSSQQVRERWGTTFRGAQFVARSGIGITSSGQLVWAASDRTSVDALAAALRDAGAVRAIQLDINAPFVRGFLFPGAVRVSGERSPFAHAVVPLVVGQTPQPLGGPSWNLPQHCNYVSPCSRDFFTLTTRSNGRGS